MNLIHASTTTHDCLLCGSDSPLHCCVHPVLKHWAHTRTPTNKGNCNSLGRLFLQHFFFVDTLCYSLMQRWYYPAQFYSSFVQPVCGVQMCDKLFVLKCKSKGKVRVLFQLESVFFFQQSSLFCFRHTRWSLCRSLRVVLLFFCIYLFVLYSVLSDCTAFAMENQSTFASLPWDSRMEIFTMIIEDLNWSELVPLLRVCKQWKVDIEFAWRCFCERRNLLRDEELLKNKFNKDWKWLCVSRTVRFKRHLRFLITSHNYCRETSQTIRQRKALDLIGRQVCTCCPPCFFCPALTLFFFCVFSLLADCVYEGEFVNGRKNGVGRLTWTNGDT